ncbi:MAG: hypothetical protein HFI88_12230 [Lachnospiraceae bacterium]|jgi:hypothetical protein|nr:hypothetical protein [Lachnospiraceae bacterium]
MSVIRFYVLVAEGVTDCSFLEAILEKYLGFVQYENIKELPPLFFEMIGTYPLATGELRRQDSPTFYYRNEIGIAVKQAGGCSQIPVKVGLLANIIDKLDVYEDFGGFLIFCDTDLHTKEEIREEFKKKFLKNDILFDGKTLKFYEYQMQCKLYLFPSHDVGAIEKLLLECTEVTYNSLFQDAQGYKNRIMQDEYQELRKRCWANKKSVQEFYSDKVQFGAVSAVLRPDKPVRFAIKDRLIKSDYFGKFMQLPEFKQLFGFLTDNLMGEKNTG